MPLNTLGFILFFVIVIILYYTVPKKYKWIFLLASSYFFYFYANVKYGLFIMITTVTSYYAALYIGRQSKSEKDIAKDLAKDEKKKLKKEIRNKKRRVLISLLLLNFGILLCLKYFNFISFNINALLESLSLTGSVPSFRFILPLGISFYTFQTMSYVIDVYWGKVDAERNLAKVALFVSFFPQITQGPIGRYKELAPQLYEGRELSYHNLKYGIQLMLWGFFKKMVIADRIATVVNYVFSDYIHISGFGTVVGVILYAIQDYTDFSGYIDIARGCAKTMGIDMAENFRRPYFSKNVAEFWRRWHISLGTWMKDYVFYPFSLTKRMRDFGKFSKLRFGKTVGRAMPIALGNILVFFLVGVWHGANWNYIVWGLFYGFILAISEIIKPLYAWLNEKLGMNVKSKGFMLFQIARTFWITCVGCIIFRAVNLTEAWQIFLKSFNVLSFPQSITKELLSFGLDKVNYIVLFGALIILFVGDVMQENMSVRGWIAKRHIMIRWSIYAAAFIIIIVFGIYGPGSNPSTFIYTQF